MKKAIKSYEEDLKKAQAELAEATQKRELTKGRKDITPETKALGDKIKALDVKVTVLEDKIKAETPRREEMVREVEKFTQEVADKLNLRVCSFLYYTYFSLSLL